MKNSALLSRLISRRWISLPLLVLLALSVFPLLKALARIRASQPPTAQGGPTTLQFAALDFSADENSQRIVVTVTRSGAASAAASVDYATNDQSAEQRADYVVAAGTLRFAAGETSRTIEIPIIDDAYPEANETAFISLSNPFGASFGAISAATLTINDNDTAQPTTNPLETARLFVRQQYYDFLARVPDQAGEDFWTNEITICGANITCIHNRRIAVSNAFFFELEFQQTGAYVYRLYRAAYGNTQPFPNPGPEGGTPILAAHIPNYEKFVNDRSRVVGSASLPQAQADLANTFVQRAEFNQRYPTTQTGPEFVDALIAGIQQSSGANLAGQRNNLIAQFNSGGRGAVIYRLADDNAQNPVNNRPFIDAEYNRSFVLTQYFGYLRRDPDMGGLNFWFGVVNQFPLRDATGQNGMVCAFSTSQEYQERLSFVSPRSNVDCGAGGPIANNAPTANAGLDQTIALPLNSVSLNGIATDDGIGTLSARWDKVSGPGNVNFSNQTAANTLASFSLEGIYILRFTAADGRSFNYDTVKITVLPAGIPPDPAMVAPPIDDKVATTVFDGTKFLYSGPNPIQTGVAPGTIKPNRAAVLRGKVTDRNQQPIPGVTITILSHPELGQTKTRLDGMFDLAVNGGGLLTVNYEKAGFMPVQRQMDVPYQDYCMMHEVCMIPADSRVSTINLNAASPIQIAQSNLVIDPPTSRRTTLMFKQGTTATMRLPGGGTQPLTTLSVRATEFTVGAMGPNAMPGDLPGTSAYTYAADYSIDEALAAGAVRVDFSQPVVQYNENFLNHTAGTNIPSGSYDKQQGIWISEPNGRVVKILSITNSLANLDITGSGAPASDADLTALGVNAAERQQLAALFSPGQSLWRVPLNHFSEVDFNHAPATAGPPNGGGASGGGGGGPNDPCEKAGCILGMQDQRLSEEVDVVGTPYFLRYDSTRQRGNSGNYTATIPLSGATVPASLKRIELTVSIAGQMREFTFPAQANQVTNFTWDGRDAYGRALQGQQTATIVISFVYDGVYFGTSAFGFPGFGAVLTGSGSRREIKIQRRQFVPLGYLATSPESLGSWTLSPHHAYDPVGKTLYEGNGKRRSVQTVSNGIETFAGGVRGFQGDGGPVSGARFTDPYGVGVAPDDTIYVADSGNGRIRRITPDGIVTTFAGNGGGCNPANFPCGDGGPAANASFGNVIRVAVARDGSVYIGGGRNLWRVTTDGVFRRVAGLALDGFSGDGGPARDAAISNGTRFFPAADGSVYLSDLLNQRIRRIDPNGIINTIAGTGTAGFSGDGGPATQAQINFPGDIVVAPDGNVYFIDQDNNRIRRIAPDGIITTYAGTGVFGVSPDGLPALQTNLVFRAANQLESGSLSIGPDGSLYAVSYVGAGGRIRRIGPDGIVTGIAGNGQFAAPGEGAPALGAPMLLSSLGLAPDGSIYAVGGFTFDFFGARIWKISPPLPAFDGANIAIPSEDGAQLFRFDANGRHLSTVNTLTGATLLTFAYDAAGRLTTVTDGDNNTTAIERNASGAPTGILSPYNQRTAFTRDANGFLAGISNPANEQFQFTYNANGQMLTESDPRNNQNQFTYDAQGRLTRDDDPATGFQTLTRTGNDLDYTVTRNTALNRQTAFRVQFLANNDRQRVNTFPDGLQNTLLERASGLKTMTAPDGTVTNEQQGGDPRFKLGAPIPASGTIATPGGVSYNQTYTRAAMLSNPADLLSLTTQTGITNINGRTYTNVFTASNRTFAMTSAGNRQSTFTTDAQGRTTQSQFANLNAGALTYDARGRLATRAFGAAAEARPYTFAYNTGGFLASYTDPLNRVNGFTYDAAGRITQRTTPDNRNIGFGYDANGNVASLTPPGRPAHAFTYTALDFLASYTAPGNVTTSFTYNQDRQLTRVTRPDAAQLNYTYNAAGILTRLDVPNGRYGYAYSATTGQLASITSPNDDILAFNYDGFLLTRQTWTGAVAGNVAQTFDNNFRIASQSVNNANTVNYAYDNDSLLTAAGALTLTRNATNGLLSGTTLNNVNDTFTYNGFAEPTNYNAKFNAATLYNADYTRDKLGRITQKVETIGGATTTYIYGYDTAGRLATVTINGTLVDTYTYDSNNNRASLNRSGATTNGVYDNQDRLTSYGANTYAYTANGELQSKTNAGQTTTYGYDVVGNLRTVGLPNSTNIAYVIDGSDRRLGKRVNGTLTQGFLYQDQLEPVAELDGAGNIVSRFVYGSRSNVPDYMVRGGVTYRIISDQTGSVRLVVDVSNGNVAQRLDYDEFGLVMADTNPGFQPFGFAGGLYDSQTKLVRFGARDYDAETGRWTAKDPILFGGGTNLYVYALNNPLNLIDVTGRIVLRALPTENDRDDETPRPIVIFGGGISGDVDGGEPTPPFDPNIWDPSQDKDHPPFVVDFPDSPPLPPPIYYPPLPISPIPNNPQPPLLPTPPNGGEGNGGNNGGGGNNDGGAGGAGAAGAAGAAAGAAGGAGAGGPCW